MTEYFTTGRAVDLILAVIAIEAVVLWLRNWRALDIVSMLLPGALILLALRAALTGASWIWIAIPLAASFPAHIADARRRKREPR